MAHNVAEEIRASGEELIVRVRDLIKEGNVRRLILKNSRDETLLEIPLAIGVIGVGGAFALAPILSSIAAFAFFAKDARILVERYPESVFKQLKNEMPDDDDASRKNSHKGSGRDPYEIDADFEVLDP